MKKLKNTLAYAAILAASMVALQARDLEGVTREAAAIFDAQQRSTNPIPVAVLANAKAIGIIKIVEAGVGFGGSGGEGVIVGNTANGWSAPVFFHQGGGSVGFQIGAHANRYIYIFNSDDTIRLFSGPDDSQFHSLAQYTADSTQEKTVAYNGLPLGQLVVYNTAEGAYAGATIGDLLVGGSDEANQKTYGTSDVGRILSGLVPAPQYAKELLQELKNASSTQGLSKDK